MYGVRNKHQEKTTHFVVTQKGATEAGRSLHWRSSPILDVLWKCNPVFAHATSLPPSGGHFISNRYPDEGFEPLYLAVPHPEGTHEAYTTWKLYLDFTLSFMPGMDPL